MQEAEKKRNDQLEPACKAADDLRTTCRDFNIRKSTLKEKMMVGQAKAEETWRAQELVRERKAKAAYSAAHTTASNIEDIDTRMTCAYTECTRRANEFSGAMYEDEVQLRRGKLEEAKDKRDKTVAE